MEKELGADVIKSTQTSLGKYIKRPPLSEKLLRKPPFRFLHDIVVAVHKTTGFFEGLFEEEEFISENVKDRDSKILFLNKVISVIGTTTGKSLSVKSSKIVAGQEPDKTNELLQCLALALDKKLSSDEAVKKYKENAKVPVSTNIKQKEKDASKTAKKSNDTKKLTSKGNEKLTTKKEPGTVNKDDTNNESKTKKKETHVAKNESQPKKSQQLRNKNTSVTVTNKAKLSSDLKANQNVHEKEKEEKHNEENNKNEEVEQLNMLTKTENTKATDEQINTTTAKDLVIHGTDQEYQEKLNSSYTIGETELNSSLSSQDIMEVEHSGKVNKTVVEDDIDYAREQFDLKQETFLDMESKTLPFKTIEPALTRDNSNDSVDKSNEPEKKKVNDKVVSISSNSKKSDVIRPPSVRPSSSRPGAPRLREKIDNVISDNDNLLLAKVNIITENTNNEDEDDPSVIVQQHTSDEAMLDNQQDQLQLSSNEHGHLVQQILDSQKEFIHVGKTEIEWQFGSQKVKDAAYQEIEQLRFNIQALSRVANPLGKLLDHMQEDAEVMRQELQQWTNVYEEVSKEMQKQKTANEETLIPLETRIKQLDIDVQEKRDKIDDLKILIHKNASRIEKLLMNGNVQ